MIAITKWLESAFNHIPLSLLEVWGRFGYLVGIVLAVAAFGGFTFRPGGRWGLGRTRQEWDAKALLSSALTFVLIFVTGYIGSSIVLVPGAQTFESLKDLSVFICILLFGYPALIAVPVAYGLSDLIEGVPPGFLADWWVGYFINPACFWIAYQFIGKNPDFRRAKTWRWYLLFVAIFMSVEPQLWGYICSGKFTSEISYRNITPALFFTTGVTWIIAPFAMLGALPLSRRYGMFWAGIAGHSRERLLGRSEWLWESGTDATPRDAGDDAQGLPVRAFLAAPVIALVLIMVGAVAYLTVRSGEVAANRLASRLHQEISDNINLKLDVYLENAGNVDGAQRSQAIDSLLLATEIADHGRAFIIDRDGGLVASSDNHRETSDVARFISASRSGDAVVQNATSHLLQLIGNLRSLQAPMQFTFDIVSAKPLARETWLAQATPYHDNSGGIDWVEVTAIPPKYYLSGVLAGNSRAAMVFAVALIFSLLLAVLLAGVLTDPIRRISRSTEAMAAGDLAQRVPAAGLLELSVLARSFNHMAAQLQESFSRTTASEIELRRHRDHLEELVDARTTALVAALDQAEAANRAKSAFLASMSHELRTPLNAVLGFAHLMTREPGRGQRDTEQLEKIQRAGEHLLDLINDVLSLSRIEANRLSLNLTAFDPRQLIDGIQEMTRVRSAARHLAFDVDVDAAVAPVVEGDEGKLRQVLLNLLGNAVKFTQAGGVELNVISVGGDRVRFEVSDTGPGIADDEIPTLFDAFVQTETGRRTGEGSGLGLHLSQGLVRLMGGEIQVSSEAGRGSRFSFEIPLPSTARRPDSRTLQRQRLTLAAVQPVLRQLVADDQADNRELLTTYLESAGFTVRAVTNGQDAVDAWLDWRPDIVWMDMRMPILDGYQATRRIRELERELALPHTTILGITASVFDHDREAVLAAGCDDVLRKPFKSHELFEMLAQHKGVLFEESEPLPVFTDSPRSEDLEALPGDWCNDFVECLSTGNVDQARQLVERLPGGDSRLGAYLRLCLKEFRMDELDRLFSAHRPL